MDHGFQPYSIGCLLPRLKDRSREADLHFFELILYMIFEMKISLVLHREKINGLLGMDFLHKVLALVIENVKKEQWIGRAYMDQECTFCSIHHLNANLRSCPYNDTLQIQTLNRADRPKSKKRK